jgi:glycosyltransferase involved in cell wall biosynthesis
MVGNYKESELIREFQNNRLKYLEKVIENEELIRKMNRQKLESYSYWYIFKILAFRFRAIYRKILQVLGNRKGDQVQENAQGQGQFNNKPYEIKLKLALPGTRKKILHVIPSFSTGGSQQLVVDIIENLSDVYDHEVLIAYEQGPKGYFGIPITLIDSNDWGYEARIDQFLKELKPDLIHIHNWASLEPIFEWRWYHTVFELSFKHQVKVVQNCNNPTFPYFDSRIVANVYVSSYAKNTFGINAPQNRVVYPGSNFNKFKRTDEFVPGDTIGMVYRLEKDKLNEKSIEPFIEVIKKRQQTKALIVGGGTWFEHYNKRVKEEGLEDNFEFTGYVSYDELPKYYARMSVFVTPVHKESFGQVTPFAMNMGVPVAGYDIGALSEIIANEALLAPPDNAIVLSEIIVDLLNDKTKMLEVSKFNKNRAQALFSLETMALEYQKLYKEIFE